MGTKSAGGEIVQVQGGHVVRCTGRKDRHSKVYTAKGPRDRRVRLSAHTAIQFYDVQDRLGYDRPSKAVDWLIKKAKSAIDKLAELPPWHPTANATEAQEAEQNAGSSEMAIAAEQSESCGYKFKLQRQLGENPDNPSGFILPPLDSDAIAIFPTTSATSSITFQNYPPGKISRTTNSSEDLGLSLHSFQYPGLIHGQPQRDGNQTPSNDQSLFAGSTPVGFEANYQRIVTWNSNASTDINTGVFMVNSLPLLGQGSTFSQRGTLQSSFSPSIRAWNDIPITSSEHHKSQASILGSRFLSDGLPVLCIPARIQGQEEDDHGVASDRPSSASPNPRH